MVTAHKLIFLAFPEGQNDTLAPFRGKGFTIPYSVDDLGQLNYDGLSSSSDNFGGNTAHLRSRIVLQLLEGSSYICRSDKRDDAGKVDDFVVACISCEVRVFLDGGWLRS